ncbi:MAG: MBL fold metallo-hydrolase [Ilumatobacter sp.]|uniref:MBL fold metallo-hydrolase n=1 Tax=Ilumatobacter sp. TaxID=1967498 RepID=UPI0026368E72|nr:MBL fold metallo-hydrolase [Ilumatobacter sp.]MDJ0769037.1 MBL fold metallo-hydrolase [Ilumatobacter sp.]
MSARPPKQEQEQASGEISEVAPGVLRAQLPIHFPGLGHVNCYLLEDGDGVALVDPGLPGAASHKTLVERLRLAGFPLRRVHTVIVTHSHPDHYGGAGRVAHETGARIVTDRRFRLMWDPAEPPDVDVEELPDVLDRHGTRYPWSPPPWGGEGIDFSFRRKVELRLARRFPRLMRTPTPTHRLDDAETIGLAGRDWVAVHTPGHTDDHLCLFDPAEGVMISGDHVLPTITPHIGGSGPNPDPLASFFASLDKVAAYGDDVSVALPAHGHPFTDLAGRVASIKEHHLDRLATIRDTAADLGRPSTVREYARNLFSARAQGGLADSETFAHLEHLCLAGEMTRVVDDRRYRYVLND